MRGSIRLAPLTVVLAASLVACAPAPGRGDETVDMSAGPAGGAAGVLPGGAGGLAGSWEEPAPGGGASGAPGEAPIVKDAGASPAPADAGFPPGSGGPAPSAFTCTQILGGMPSDDWYEIDRIFTTIAGPDFELQGHTGIRHWANPGDAVWGNSPDGPCPRGSGSPDRVWLIIWGHDNQPTTFWEEQTREAIAAIRQRRPRVKQIMLSPEVGGPSCRQHYSGYNFNNIVAAIERVVSADVVAGPRVRIDDCALYEGKFGTLTDEGARRAARGLADAVRGGR